MRSEGHLQQNACQTPLQAFDSAKCLPPRQSDGVMLACTTPSCESNVPEAFMTESRVQSSGKHCYYILS